MAKIDYNFIKEKYLSIKKCFILNLSISEKV